MLFSIYCVVCEVAAKCASIIPKIGKYPVLLSKFLSQTPKFHVTAVLECSHQKFSSPSKLTINWVILGSSSVSKFFYRVFKLVVPRTALKLILQYHFREDKGYPVHSVIRVTHFQSW